MADLREEGPFEFAHGFDDPRTVEIPSEEETLRVGEVLMLDGRWLRVSGMPDGETVCRDYRKRVAVRNFATNRLSYIPERRLLAARKRA